MFRSVISKSLLPIAVREGRRPILARSYHEKVISHYEQPRNVGLMTPLTHLLLSDNGLLLSRWARYQRVTSTSGPAWLEPQRMFRVSTSSKSMPTDNFEQMRRRYEAANPSQ